MILALKIIIIVVTVLLLLYYIFPIACISGDSMFPTYKEKDKTVATRIFSKENLKVGDIVIYCPPESDYKVIKRISSKHKNNIGTLVFCVGDNKEVSYDSRDYGWIEVKDIVAKVIKPRKYKESEV